MNDIPTIKLHPAKALSLYVCACPVCGDLTTVTDTDYARSGGILTLSCGDKGRASLGGNQFPRAARYIRGSGFRCGVALRLECSREELCYRQREIEIRRPFADRAYPRSGNDFGLWPSGRVI
jgi:hypothetical protein